MTPQPRVDCIVCSPTLASEGGGISELQRVTQDGVMPKCQPLSRQHPR